MKLIFGNFLLILFFRNLSISILDKIGQEQDSIFISVVVTNIKSLVVVSLVVAELMSVFVFPPSILILLSLSYPYEK